MSAAHISVIQKPHKQTKTLTKSLGRKISNKQEEQLVLNNVNLQIEEGEFVYITGKVGTGKSSLLKTLYGELPVSEGEAEVMGYDMTTLKQSRLPELRKKLGIIFQDFQLLTDRSVDSNLRFVLKATGWKNKVDIDQRISDVLQLVGMSTKGYKMPSELSGGEQQRIVIARAILNSPKLILADEPTGNLDHQKQRHHRVQRHIKALHSLSPLQFGDLSTS